MDPSELKIRLFEFLRQEGASLTGAADLTGVVCGGKTVGISVAVPVPRTIVEDLKTAPTREYCEIYSALNRRLDWIVTAGVDFLESLGYQAYANTTKAVKKDENMCTPLPHKTVAAKAGLGWIGKSCLLVTKEYGSAVRLSSLLTDAPIPPDGPPVENQCGGCNQCVKFCPGQALSGEKWSTGTPREQLLDKDICQETQFERMLRFTGIDTDLCGRCFAVCPFTQEYLKRQELY